MASTIGAWSYVKNDGSLSTKDDVNSNLSSTGKNKSTTNKTTLDVCLLYTSPSPRDCS